MKNVLKFHVHGQNHLIKKMELTTFIYSWYIDNLECDTTVIRAYGVTKENKNVCLKITNFRPYVYIELPNTTLSKSNIINIVNYLKDLIRPPCRSSRLNCSCFKCTDPEYRNPFNYVLTKRKKLYYYNTKRFPYLRLDFSSKKDIRTLQYRLNRPFNIPGMSNVILRMHEQNASPILQLTTQQKIPTAGVVKVIGTRVNNKKTSCDFELSVRSCNVLPVEEDYDTSMFSPLIMSFDIEVYSHIPTKMPKCTEPQDKVFQISIVLHRPGGKKRKFLLSLGDPLSKKVGKDVKIYTYPNEAELIMGYTDFINKYNPNVIVGYNIFGFDIPYLIGRAIHNPYAQVIEDFARHGFPLFQQAEQKTIKWSSGAYGTQQFEFLDAEGRLYVDLLPIVKRDFKLDNYKLKTVSEYFIGKTKDPLNASDIFKCFEKGMLRDENNSFTMEAKHYMAVCGKYCVQDSLLVSELVDKLDMWIGLCEMAKVCRVPIFYLYTQGQQIKVFSQIYNYCTHNNIVVEQDVYIPKEDERYQGAYVFDPKPGVYDRVIPFDFASLYPTTIIAYNIDYSTLVTDENVPDEKCNIVQWSEHVGCEHDDNSCNCIDFKGISKVSNMCIFCKKRKILSTNMSYICKKYRYRFIKEPKGIMPTLLSTLLDTRKQTRKYMKTIDKASTLYNVLNKRQLAYKVSANSMYGAMGVKRGYLPFMIGAMCVTAKGRESVKLAAKEITSNHKGELVYGDTDSTYIIFPHLKTAHECWEYSESVSNKVSQLFPPPMKLEFEEVIYWRFFILTKKRYMSLTCCKDGKVSQDISKKGVLLARRDNSGFIRQTYANLVMKIFNKSDMRTVMYDLYDTVNKLLSASIPNKKFIITKSVGDVNDMKIEKSDTPSKVMIGQYKVPFVGNNTQTQSRNMKLKKCNDIKTYYERCLPAQVQLAQRMKRRGQRVPAGTRLEYIVSTTGGHSGKMFEKLEHIDYYRKHHDIIKIDYLYYLKMLVNPVDQVLNIFCDDHPELTRDFMLKLYKTHCKKHDMVNEIKNIFKPTIELSK